MQCSVGLYFVDTATSGVSRRIAAVIRNNSVGTDASGARQHGRCRVPWRQRTRRPADATLRRQVILTGEETLVLALASLSECQPTRQTVRYATRYCYHEAIGVG